MLLDLSRMQGSREHLDRSYDPGALDLGDDARLAANLRLVVDLEKDGAQYRLVGRVETSLTRACGRCLEAFTRPVDLRFDLLYLPQAENRGEGESEVQADDLAVAYYRDDQIDLGQLMREQVYLNLDMKPLCGAECKGLCVECGANLNAGPCACRRAWTDPRWAALEEWRRGRTDR